FSYLILRYNFDSFNEERIESGSKLHNRVEHMHTRREERMNAEVKREGRPEWEHKHRQRDCQTAVLCVRKSFSKEKVRDVFFSPSAPPIHFRTSNQWITPSIVAV